jgi:hypothetical protein
MENKSILYMMLLLIVSMCTYTIHTMVKTCTISAQHKIEIKQIQDSLELEINELTKQLRNLSDDYRYPGDMHIETRYILSSIIKLTVLDFSQQNPSETYLFLKKLIDYFNDLLVAIQREPSEVPGVIHPELQEISQALSRVLPKLKALSDTFLEACGQSIL